MKTWIFAALVATAVLGPRFAYAFSFQPSVVEFTLADAQLSKIFTVDNTGSTKVGVQISAHSRIQDENGKENLPATAHFSIFPKQLILAPGESKTVRVTYVGPKSVAKEAAYRVIAEQLPLDLKAMEPAQGTRLKFLIKYQTSVYVVPAGAKSKIVIESARAVVEKPSDRKPKDKTIDAKKLADKKTDDKKPNDKKLELVFRNDGDAHRILSGAKVVLRSSKQEKVSFPLPGDLNKQLETVNVLAGTKRRVLLPWPADIPKAVHEASSASFDAASIEFD